MERLPLERGEAPLLRATSSIHAPHELHSYVRALEHITRVLEHIDHIRGS